MKSKIYVIGSSNTDMVVKSNFLPKPGETVIGDTFLMNPGGKGANQAVSACKLGADVTFITKVGNDMFGKKALNNFKKIGIKTDYISNYANICKSLQFYETLGVSAFFRDLLLMLKNDSFIYYFL